jgi:hypothetical protein
VARRQVGERLFYSTNVVLNEAIIFVGQHASRENVERALGLKSEVRSAVQPGY